MEKPLTPFNILFNMNKGIFHTKEEVISSGLNVFLLLQFIRATPILSGVAGYINKNWKMNIYDQYLFVFLTFKRFNIKNVTWIKSEKIQKPEDVEIVQRYYNVSYIIANRYLLSLTKEKIKEINDYYDTGGVKK